MIRRYSKPLGAVQWFQEDALSSDATLCATQREIEQLLALGEKAESCMLCSSAEPRRVGFARHGLNYVFCENCGHISADRALSNEFLQKVYGTDESPVYGEEFTSGRMSEEYWEVVERIYLPKAQFLKDVLDNLNVQDPSVLDFGCGSGHFMNALLQVGFSDVRGVDTMPKAVASANATGLASRVSLVRPEDAQEILRSSDATVVSMMCVLPHLASPLGALQAMSSNVRTRYTFQKLPMWSFATLLEAATPERRARVLGQDHTNAFTHESLSWLERAVPMTRHGEWWFGQDILDLLRKAAVSGSPGFADRVTELLSPAANRIQASIDRSELSSELHAVWGF